MEVTGQAEDFLTVIDTHTSGAGRAGNVNITTGDLQATGAWKPSSIPAPSDRQEDKAAT